MKFFENKIPPPIVAVIAALCMFGCARISTPIDVSDSLRLFFSILFLVIGMALDIPAIVAFRQQKTTVNPIHIERTTELVASGAYGYSRNPMYLGMLCILLAWMIFLAAPLALLGPLIFVAYITKFQILPEERFLKSKFGERYNAYQNRVRRWI